MAERRGLDDGQIGCLFFGMLGTLVLGISLGQCSSRSTISGSSGYEDGGSFEPDDDLTQQRGDGIP